MKDQHKVIRQTLIEYFDWYERNEQRIGFSDRTMEQRARDMGVKRSPSIQWDKEVWASNKETIVPKRESPTINYPRKSFSYLLRILPELPIWMFNIIKYTYNPKHELPRPLAAKKLKYTTRTYDRRLSDTLQEIQRKMRYMR